MFRSSLLSSVLIAIVVAVGGCAGTDRRSAPPLDGAQGNSALVVVEFEGTVRVGLGIARNRKVDGGMLLSADGFARVEGRAVSNLIVFSDVPPGEYRLARIDTTFQPVEQVCSGQPMVCRPGVIYSRRFEIPADRLREYAVIASLGVPKFLGAIAVEERYVPENLVTSISSRAVNVALSRSKEAEARVWTRFAQIFDGHPWAAEARKRIAELAQ